MFDNLAPESSPRWYRHPLFLTVLASLALLFLVSAVYTVAVQARQLSRSAEEVHALNETLRVLSGTRSELTNIETLNLVASAGNIDVAEPLRLRLDQLKSDLEVLKELTENPSLRSHPSVVAATTAFIDAATSHAESMDTNAAATLTADGQRPYVPTFESAISTIQQARTKTLDQLEATNATMNRVGSTAGFGIAFIVPAIALYVFEALRRTRLRARIADEHLARRRVAQRRGATETAGKLDGLSRDLQSLRTTSNAGDGSPQKDLILGMAQRVEGLRKQALVSGAVATTEHRDVNVGDAIASAIDQTGLAGKVEVAISLDSPVMRTDSDHLHLILVELLENAQTHGGSSIRLVAHEWEDSVSISVSDDGSGLPPRVERAIFRADLPELRDELETGEMGNGLRAVRGLAETLGGTFTYERIGGLTQLTLHLPSAAVPSPAPEEDPAWLQSMRPVSTTN